MTVKFIIEPLVGIEVVGFGDSRADIRKRLGAFDSFKRTPISKTESDYYQQHDLCVYYDENFNAEAFEFGDGANVEFNKVELSSLTYEKLKQYVASLDHNLEVDTDDFTSYKIGFGGNCSNETEGWGSVIVFQNGYYE